MIMSQAHPDRIPIRLGQPTGVSGPKTPACCEAIVAIEIKEIKKNNTMMAVASHTARRADRHESVRNSFAL